MSARTTAASGFSLGRISAAHNDVYFNEDGSSVIDLFGANGSVFLGHGEPRIRAALNRQIDKVWNTGSVPTGIRLEAERAVESLFGGRYRCLGLYTTGMEAVEFAIRVARVVTGKPGVAGFERAMHGKSMATSQLSWANDDGIELPDVVRLPGIAANDEGDVLSALERSLESANLSAVFVEPLQATGGGYCASVEYHREVARLCREFQAMLVYDEILTGCFRTGPAFMLDEFAVVPDLVIIGKALGNGFPIAAVMGPRDLALDPRMLPGSTFAGNPLAAAVAVEVVNVLRSEPVGENVERIGRTIRESIEDNGFLTLRGRGAVWIATLASADAARAVAENLYRQGVLVGHAGNFLRLLPPATITEAHLDEACAVLRRVLATSCVQD